jgi:hypothetical protein
MQTGSSWAKYGDSTESRRGTTVLYMRGTEFKA